VRTDGGSSPPGQTAIYDAVRNRFYVADSTLGRILILDPGTESIVGSIAVPGALTVDESPDHSTLYTASLVGDVYTIDPVAMQVTHRYVSSEIGPSGFVASAAYALASGQLALLGGQGPLAGVDGASSFAVWAPATNALAVYYGGSGGIGASGAGTAICGSLINIGGFLLSGDRARIIVGSIDSDATLCSLDPSTGSFVAVTATGNTTVISASPDGTSLALPAYSGSSGSVVIYNARTLTQTGAFPVQSDTSSDSSMLFSADSKTLYATSSSFVFAYTVSTGAAAGWLPSLFIPQLTGSFGTTTTHPSLQAIDRSGLLFGPIEEGVAFLDTTALRPLPLGTAYSNGYLTPAFGPVGGGTSVQWDAVSTAGLASAYFGPNPATSLSQDSTSAYATTPAGAPGPVDVITTASDGGVQYLPEAFSYGPSLLEATPDFSTAEGTGTGVLFGYGFGSTAYSATPTIPSDLHLTIGGQPATLTGYLSNAYNADSPPMPLQALTYTLPAHSAGASDIVLTSASGSVTLAGGMTYLGSTQQFPLDNAALTEGIYDPLRDLYYFANTSEIEVFSKTLGKWLSPIAVPTAPAGTAHRLWSLALSPDSSKLAVSDAGSGQIFLLDPAGQAAPQTFLFSSGRSDVTALPAGVAVSDTGVIYFGAFYPDGDTGYPGIYKVNTATGIFTSIAEGPGLASADSQLHPILSADGVRLFVNIDGQIASIDTASLDDFYANAGQGCCYGNYELALSSNQTSLVASGYLLDSDMHGEAAYSYNVRESAEIEFVYGAKMSPDGALVFQPGTASLDIIDGHRGTLLHRIELPFALSQNFDALVSDGRDNSLIAITGAGGTGIAVIDLTALPEPAPPPYTPEHRGGLRRTTPPQIGARQFILRHRTRAEALLSRR
jgi:WD40 repeat protein